jgi:methylenetetrahydrofolate--tRNA-(uracil-5-)-methyltransferase
MKNDTVTIIGGGLAGSEAAYQLLKRGFNVVLYEMRPKVMTPAHKTDYLAEIVCSNSFGSSDPNTSGGVLKRELKLLDSLLLKKGEESSIPAGHALAVDRELFSKSITKELEKFKNLTIIRKEIEKIPFDSPVIIATGPLTSKELSYNLMKFTGRENLFFYDATSPIVEISSINREIVFPASRYGRGGEDYLNAPFTEEEYKIFYNELLNAEKVPLKEFEKHLFFEACLPIEELAARGERTLAFGPLKPIGLSDPRTGKMPHAVVQLRQDNLAAEHYQLVGFQTRLTWSEQKRVFRLIPGLEKAEFVRYGVMHRNSYINAPLILNRFFQTKDIKDIFIVGQLSGLEGYVEAIASGLYAGIMMAKHLKDEKLVAPPRSTALGALGYYLENANYKNFQPTKFVFGLLEPPGIKIKDKRDRRRYLSQKAAEQFDFWMKKFL